MVDRQAAATTREAERVIPHAANPVLGLTITAALETEPTPQCVMDRIAKQLLCGRRLDVPLFADRFAEKQSELRSDSAKLRGRRDGQIDLQAFRDKKNSIES